MKYPDPVYGGASITKPFILEMLDCPSMQRLKKVNSAGYFEPFTGMKAHSRFEHSVGVYLLLQRHGAPIEEQIRGLVHDVSHAAFSHCIDYVVEEGSEAEQSHQDNVFAEFVQQSEIPGILQRYKFDVEYILGDDACFPLLEQPLPDLCADRIDYALRGALSYHEIERDDIEYFLEHLAPRQGRWVFRDERSAYQFAELFRMMNRKYWAGLPSARMFRTVSDCLQYALEQEYVTRKDLYTSDDEVIAKVRQHLSADEKLARLFARMNNQVQITNDPDNFDAKVVCKSRIVDPFCWYGRSIRRVSDIFPEWASVVEEELLPKDYFLKFERS